MYTQVKNKYFGFPFVGYYMDDDGSMCDLVIIVKDNVAVELKFSDLKYIVKYITKEIGKNVPSRG